MSVDFDRSASRLRQCLPLLRTLAQTMVACQRESMAMNLDGIYRCISEQEQLCRQIHALQAADGPLPPPSTDPKRSADLNFLAELSEARAEIDRLNRIQAAYFRRCGRTVNVLINAWGVNATGYAPPAASRDTAAVG